MATKTPRLIGVINSATNTISFSIYTTPDFILLASHEIQLITNSPKDGWFEQDPIEMVESARICAEKACSILEKNGYKISDIISIGVTNQRETTIVWDKYTGQPLYNAIGWNDIRANVTVEKILAKLPDQNKNYFKHLSGLPVHPYFSALKIRWLKDNIDAVRRASKERRCLAGTVDSWLIWNLTGGANGGIHITDVTNASRTFLMNIETLHWDPLLTRTFSIHPKMLPEIRSSSEIYGQVNDGSVLNGKNISGILGNQQASLLGQRCLKPGQTKSTYRAGCFLLCNTGENKVMSEHGLLTTIAYKLGKDAPTIYALEGAVAVAGSALNWLKNNLGLLSDLKDVETLANTVNSTGDVYFVPAFTGLYAPYWRQDARGVICGLTQFTTKNHIIRATLEAICFQNRDIFECMFQECFPKIELHHINKLYADGELTRNVLLMQLQADILGMPVFVSQYHDTASFGVAMCAAQAQGIDAYEINPYKYDQSLYDTYLPTTTDEERDLRYTKWKKAIERSLNWIQPKRPQALTEERFRLLSSIPGAIFIITTFGLLTLSAMTTAN